jgi:kynurenine formamidase
VTRSVREAFSTGPTRDRDRVAPRSRSDTNCGKLAPVAVPTEADVLSWFDDLSNWGRWGPDDELGTLNLITPEVRKRAAKTVNDGITVSCAWEVPTGPLGLERVLTAAPRAPGTRLGFSSEQISSMTVHGYAVTHLDALCHIFWDGQMYNGRPAELVSGDGAQALPITVARRGVITRGVLLDVAAARGVPWLEPGEGALPDDLEAAEERQGVRVEPGDAVFLRTGFGRYRRETGKVSGADAGIAQPGWQAAALPWLRRRDVSLIGCDTANDVSPSGYRAIPLPVHIIGLVSMGLWLVDNCDLEDLATTAARLSRWEFHLAVGPLALSGLTSSPVNPIATF